MVCVCVGYVCTTRVPGRDGFEVKDLNVFSFETDLRRFGQTKEIFDHHNISSREILS